MPDALTFKEATDRAKDAGVNLAAVASHFGVAPPTVSRWRRDDPVEAARDTNRFGPPDDWAPRLTALVESAVHEREMAAAALRALAGDLAAL